MKHQLGFIAIWGFDIAAIFWLVWCVEELFRHG